LEAGNVFTPYSWATQFMMKARYGGQGPSPPLSLASTPTSSPPTTLKNLFDIDMTSPVFCQKQRTLHASTESSAASAPVARDFAVSNVQTSLPSPTATFGSPPNSPQTSDINAFSYPSSAAPLAPSQLEVIPEESMGEVEMVDGLFLEVCVILTLPQNAYPTPPAECIAFLPSLLPAGCPDAFGEGNTPLNTLGQFARAPLTTHDFSTPFDRFLNSLVGFDCSGNPAVSSVSPRINWDGSTNVSWPSGNLPESVTPHNQTFEASPIHHISSHVDPAVQSGPNSWDLDITQLNALAPPSSIASDFDWGSIAAVYPSNEDSMSPSFAASIESQSMRGFQELSSASSEPNASENPMDTLWQSLLLTSQQFDRELSQAFDRAGGNDGNGDLYPPPLHGYESIAHAPPTHVPDLIPYRGPDAQGLWRNGLPHAVQSRLSGWNPVNIDSRFSRSTANVANQFSNLQLRGDSYQGPANIPQYTPPPVPPPNQISFQPQIHAQSIPVASAYAPRYSSYDDQHRRNAHLPSQGLVHAPSSASYSAPPV
jgi:hypothetical protein